MGSTAINNRAYFDQKLMDVTKSNPLTRTQALGYTFDESVQTMRSLGKAVLDCFDTKVFTSSEYQDIVARSWEQVGHRLSVTFCLAMTILFPEKGSESLHSYLDANSSEFTDSDQKLQAALARSNSGLRKDNDTLRAENAKLQAAAKSNLEAVAVDSSDIPVAVPIVLTDAQKVAVEDAVKKDLEGYKGRDSWHIGSGEKYYGFAKISQNLVDDIVGKLNTLLAKGGEVTDQDIANIFPVEFQETISVIQEGKEVEVPAMTKDSSSKIEGWGEKKISAKEFVKWRDDILKAATTTVVSQEADDLSSE